MGGGGDRAGSGEGFKRHWGWSAAASRHGTARQAAGSGVRPRRESSLGGAGAGRRITASADGNKEAFGLLAVAAGGAEAGLRPARGGGGGGGEREREVGDVISG